MFNSASCDAICGPPPADLAPIDAQWQQLSGTPFQLLAPFADMPLLTSLSCDYPLWALQAAVCAAARIAHLTSLRFSGDLRPGSTTSVVLDLTPLAALRHLQKLLDLEQLGEPPCTWAVAPRLRLLAGPHSSLHESCMPSLCRHCRPACACVQGLGVPSRSGACACPR